MKTKKIFAVILVVAIVLSVSPVTAAAAFSDVPENHPYKAAIDFCQAKHFVVGTGADTFLPDASLTRAQLAVIWCRLLSIRDNNHSFTDVTRLNRYYDSAVILMRGLGILNGTSTTRFSPDDYVTREQLALLTMRSYQLGVENPEDYQQYADHASISDWARDGVSSCINANVLEGLYDGQNFSPKQAVTRAEICKLIYNISTPAYTVTIGTLTGGTITASPMQARPGTLITLTITPDTGMQLKAGTLKYNDVDITGSTFTMPAEDVTVTAEPDAL
ncbi:MAG: S-layer homology domain-containing protein [Clostridia bacterium]|nr:S-layer homology domain-containing protein [Clostridia bacterium]